MQTASTALLIKCVYLGTCDATPAASLLLASILVFLKLEHVMHHQLFHYRLHILCVTSPKIVKNTQKH